MLNGAPTGEGDCIQALMDLVGGKNSDELLANPLNLVGLTA
jgi:hypothetical protein